MKLIFDNVKKHCQDNKIPCFIYIDGLDDAEGQEISKGYCRVLNSSKNNNKKGYPYFCPNILKVVGSKR
jgi:hypothetical protein